MALTGIYFLLGTIPFPWRRQTAAVAVAAFLIPLWIIGWISWRIEYFLIFEHVGAWENLPSVILGPENLAMAALGCAAGVLGHRLTTARRPSSTVNAI